MPRRNIVTKKLQLEQLETRAVPTVVCTYTNNSWPDPNVYIKECNYLDALIAPSTITDQAVGSGNWSNPATWSHGVPVAGDTVWIPKGDSVVVDGVFSADLRAILNNGDLSFKPSVNTGLTLNTLVNGDEDVYINGVLQDGIVDGSMEIGTASNPIQAGVTAKLTFDDDVFNPAVGMGGSSEFPNDWRQLSHGLVSMGSLSIYGSTITPFVNIASGATAGNTALQLSRVPVGWQTGDSLLIPGVSPSANQDEQPIIASISGTTLTLTAPLQFSHTSPHGQAVQVADEHRNVTITSTNTALGHQGHVMEMHNDSVSIGYAAFTSLGRTDKSVAINNPVLNSSGTGVVAGTGTNPDGRYGLHFHRDYAAGFTDNDPPIAVTGCYESNSPGWGYVNHSSNVDFESDVSFNVEGAGFVLQSGNELGTFNGCLAIRDYGAGVGRQDSNGDDGGHGGDGFWLRSAQVVLTNDIAADAFNAGFFWVTQAVFPQFENSIPIKAWDGRAVQAIPLSNVNNIETYADNLFGISSWSHAPTTHDTITGFTSWNLAPYPNDSHAAVFFRSSNSGLDNAYIDNSGTQGQGFGVVAVPGYSGSMIFNHDQIDGYSVGLSLADSQFVNTVNGGEFDDTQGIDFQSVGPNPDQAAYYVNGQPTFGPHTQYQYHFDPQPTINASSSYYWFDWILSNPSPTYVQQSDGSYKELYAPEQAASYIPFPTSGTPYYLNGWVAQGHTIPPQLVGLTNAQLWSQYGLAMDGAVAPADAVTSSITNGLYGSSTTYGYIAALDIADVLVQHANLSTFKLGYRLSTPPPNYATITNVQETTVTPLVQGWNLVTRTLPDGTIHTFLIFGL